MNKLRAFLCYTKQVDADTIDSNKVQDATVAYDKEGEVKILDNNGSNDKCEVQNETDEKAENDDNNNNS